MTAQAIPAWPRMMRKDKAAAYCDLPVAAFDREVFQGRLPQAVKLGGRDHWCRSALDAALDVIAGNDTVPDHIREFNERYG